MYDEDMKQERRIRKWVAAKIRRGIAGETGEEDLRREKVRERKKRTKKEIRIRIGKWIKKK
jgi:hypothetical protein